MVDIGKYNGDPERYGQLIRELYASCPPITMPPEYAGFLENNLAGFLIRLSRYKFVARLIKKGDRVLEVGCGSGVGSLFMAQHCAQVTGIDVKETEIDEARAMNRRDNVSFIHGDLFEVPVAEKYDVVVALDVIEHMPEAAGNRLVAAMKEHLSDRGILFVGSPSIYSYEYQGELSRASHVKCYDRDELVGLVENHFDRTLTFSMNDEVVHTGHPKMAWYYFVLGCYPNPSSKE